MADLFASFFVVIGSAFVLLAGIGLVRFPDVYMRMHAATKAGTLGAGGILIALAVHSGEPDVIVKAVAGIAFLILTAPISSHLLGRAAYCYGVELWDRSVQDDLRGRYAFDERPPKATPLCAQDYE